MAITFLLPSVTKYQQVNGSSSFYENSYKNLVKLGLVSPSLLQGVNEFITVLDGLGEHPHVMLLSSEKHTFLCGVNKLCTFHIYCSILAKLAAINLHATMSKTYLL